ncbi:MAG: rod-binding protein [Acetobacteraceae bacterium]
MQKAWGAAQDFEAMAIGQFLTPMFNTIDLSKSPFGGGEAEQAWKPMMIDAVAKQITKAGGLGLAQPVFTQMIHMQEAKENAP